MIIKIDPLKPDPMAIEQATESLSAGELVIFPTETVYGVAVDPAVEGALERLYIAKGRKPEKPVARFAGNIKQIEEAGGQLNRKAYALAERFWPGPMTLVIPASDGLTGFRIPDHPIPLELLKTSKKLLAVTSANRSGQADTHSAQQAAEQIGEHVALILDAGIIKEIQPSTVVCVTDDYLRILRKGPITEEEISAALT